MGRPRSRFTPKFPGVERFARPEMAVRSLRRLPAAQEATGFPVFLPVGVSSTRAVRVASLGEETPQQQPQAPDWAPRTSFA